MTDATELDEAAIRARYQRACGELDRMTQAEGGPGAAWRWSIPANPERDTDLILSDSLADLPAALDEITRLRAALDEALSDHLCACGYGVVCGQCQRVDRARAEAAEKALDEARAEAEQRRSQLATFVDAHAVWVERNEATTARAEAAESALTTVRAGLTEALDELVECRSFISVETRHYPTVHAINEVVEHLRPLATPTTMERNKG